MDETYVHEVYSEKQRLLRRTDTRIRRALLYACPFDVRINRAPLYYSL